MLGVMHILKEAGCMGKEVSTGSDPPPLAKKIETFKSTFQHKITEKSLEPLPSPAPKPRIKFHLDPLGKCFGVSVY